MRRRSQRDDIYKKLQEAGELLMEAERMMEQGEPKVQELLPELNKATNQVVEVIESYLYHYSR